MSAVPKLKDTKDKRSAFKGRGILIKGRRLTDFAARIVVTFGGIFIILCILAILIFISLEVYPLWKGATAELEDTINLDPPSAANPASVSTDFPIAGLGVEQYKEIGFVITKSGAVNFISLENGTPFKQVRLEKLNGKQVTAASGSLDNEMYALGTEDGFILPVEIGFNVSFTENLKGIESEVVEEAVKEIEKAEEEAEESGTTVEQETESAGAGEEEKSEGIEKITERIIEPEVEEGEPIQIASLPLTHVAYQASDEDAEAAAAVTSDGKLIFASRAKTAGSLLGEGEIQESKYDLTPRLSDGKVTAVVLDGFLDNLYAGTESGKLYHWNVRDKENPKLADVISAAGDGETAVTALGFLIGNRSLIVGDEAGNVSIWFQVQDKASPTGSRLKKAHVLASHGNPVTAVAASPRDKSLITADSEGDMILHHSTSEQKLLEMKGEGSSIKALAYAPKANGAIAIDENGTLYDWNIENPHPETTLKTLFGKVWYEGYSKSEYVWQSTGGTDDFESKISLTPLAYGTLKGTFYALLFAIPIAILSAICVSQFMHPSLRNMIKPVIEVMAALPSVVLGFLAGLWLAPLVEKILPAMFLMPVVLVAMTIISVILWRLAPRYIRAKFKSGAEFLLLIPVFFLGVQICLWLNTPIETFMLGGDYKSWLFGVLGLQYDQRNSLIVGFAMAFAVIPIIFTISEDALSNVPKHLSSGSLALGATKWQTAIRVVLPTAAAGIFSAVMIGFGRAVGETMIVLMATGNTPIMDWSIFNGFRALSANIAVEIPEAPHGGTLYRALFLAALLLFIMTFILNTIAELVRQRLRKKYGQL